MTATRATAPLPGARVAPLRHARAVRRPSLGPARPVSSRLGGPIRCMTKALLTLSGDERLTALCNFISNIFIILSIFLQIREFRSAESKQIDNVLC